MRVSFAKRKERAETAPCRKSGNRGQTAAAPKNSLYEALRSLRTELAKAESVPAYVVFSNAALADMAVKRPENMVEFLEVSGVGEYKTARYGRTFLKVIREWEENVHS